MIFTDACVCHTRYMVLCFDATSRTTGALLSVAFDAIAVLQLLHSVAAMPRRPQRTFERLAQDLRVNVKQVPRQRTSNDARRYIHGCLGFFCCDAVR